MKDVFIACNKREEKRNLGNHEEKRLGIRQDIYSKHV